MAEANIIVIPKEGKDTQYPQNYRPISLINIDSKLYAKILATRLNKVLPHLISSSQVGFLKTRLSSGNTRLLCHVIETLSKKQDPAVMITLDAEKAFDRVSWEFLECCMEQYNLGDQYIKMTMALYNKPRARVVVNAGSSDPLQLQHGTRQGCPPSPALFLLAIEPLIQDIKDNKVISGVTVNGTTVKLAAYSDDILIITESPQTSITGLMQSINSYSQYAGYKLNKEKSEVKPLNIHTSKDVLGDSGLKWQTGFVKYLGIYFGKDLHSTIEHNKKTVLDKVKTQLDSWSPRLITWWGRIETIKMMTTPLINYFISMLPMLASDEFHSKTERMINNFIWCGKKPRISLKKLRLERKMGGLNISDPRLMQLAFLAKQGAYWLLPTQAYTPVWLDLERALLSNLDPVIMLTANKHPLATNPVMKNTKLALLKIDRKMEKSIKNTNWESLWANSKIKYKGKPLDMEKWETLGISTPNDLLKDNIPHTFETLKERFNLLDIDFYNFLNIRTAITKANLAKNSEPSIIKYMANINTVGHQAAHIYKLLRPQTQNLNNKPTSYWEGLLHSTLSDKERQQLWNSASQHKISPTLAQTKFWLLHRLHWTPARLAKLGLRENDRCWNCDSLGEDLAHMIFHCPKVTKLWEEIFTFINSTLRIKLTPEFATLTTACITMNLPSTQDRDLLDLLLTSAVKLILTNWKDTAKVLYNQWINWVVFLRGADNINLQNSPWKQSTNGMWDSLDDVLHPYKPP